MKKQIIYKQRLDRLSTKLFVLALLIISISACTKLDDGIPPIGEHPGQFFSPVINLTVPIGSTAVQDPIGASVAISWAKTPNATYEIQYSKDSMLFTTDTVRVFNDTVTSFRLAGLDALVNYSFRVRAISKDPNVKDSRYAATTFKCPLFPVYTNINGYNCLLATPADNGSAVLTWNSAMDVTHIVQSSTKLSHVLTPTEKTAGTYTYTGIKNNIADTFKIYRRDGLRGIAIVNNILVTFNYQIPGLTNTTVRINSGTPVTRPKNPTYAGKTFVNWYKDATGTAFYTFSDNSKSANIEIFAKWTP